MDADTLPEADRAPHAGKHHEVNQAADAALLLRNVSTQDDTVHCSCCLLSLP